MGFFDFFRRRRGPVQVARSREDTNDLSWWWIYFQQQTPTGDDSAVRQMEEVCRQRGVDPQGQGSLDVGSVPGLEAALAETCQSSGIDVPTADTVVTYEVATGGAEVTGVSLDSSSWSGDSGGGDSGGGGGDSGGGGGGGGE